MNRRSLALAALVLGSAACSRLTAPVDDQVTPMPEPVAAASAEPAAPAPAPTPTPAPAPPPKPEMIKASHILVAYKGAMRADPAIKRTKEEAKKLAADLQKKAQKEDFAALAKKHSDDKGSGANGGELGEFSRTQMVKPFADAAFALKPGEVSAVVESDFGFHIIKRPK